MPQGMLAARRNLIEVYAVDACTAEDSSQTARFEELLNVYADAVRMKAIEDCKKALRDHVDPRALEHT